MNTANVIEFPKNRLIRASQKEIDTIIDNIVAIFTTVLSVNQVNIHNEDVCKMFRFAMESARAAAYKGLDIEHPLHALLNDYMLLAENKMALTK